MKRTAFSYYVGTGILVFILYASFLRGALQASFGLWLLGVVAGALALILVLVAIAVAWRTNGNDHA
jgi:hypothetical protein